LQGLPSTNYALDLLKAAEAAAPRVLWKTTTHPRNDSSRWNADSIPRSVFPEVFDAALLTSSVPKENYWDRIHFRAAVYNKLNAALLRQLYGEPDMCHFEHGKCKDPRRRRGKAAAVAKHKSSGYGGLRGVRRQPLATWSTPQLNGSMLVVPVFKR